MRSHFEGDRIPGIGAASAYPIRPDSARRRPAAMHFNAPASDASLLSRSLWSGTLCAPK